MTKGLEGKEYEEWPESLGLFSPYQRRLRWCGEADADLWYMGTVQGPKGTPWSCIRGGSEWVLGKGTSPRGWLSTRTDSPGEWSWSQACWS